MGGDQQQCYVRTVAGISTLKPVLPSYRPAWSADGQKIAYQVRAASDDWEIYVLNVDGSNQHNITNNAVADDIPRLEVNILWWRS